MITSTVNFKKINFPCGEPHVTVERVGKWQPADIVFEFESADEIVTLLLLADAIKRDGGSLGRLYLPYVPFSRQDRVANKGEAFSLKVFCDLINGLKFEQVRVCDPHSDVSIALLNNLNVIHQHEMFGPCFAGRENFWLISPDGGALKKIYKLAAVTKSLGVVECSKQRDTQSGAITSTKVHATDLKGHDCFIVDDICDGGGTFIQIAKELKNLSAGKIHLMVTHGFFNRGLEVFDGLIDHIYTLKGQLK